MYPMNDTSPRQFFPLQMGSVFQAACLCWVWEYQPAVCMGWYFGILVALLLGCMAERKFERKGSESHTNTRKKQGKVLAKCYLHSRDLENRRAPGVRNKRFRSKDPEKDLNGSGEKFINRFLCLGKWYCEVPAGTDRRQLQQAGENS